MMIKLLLRNYILSFVVMAILTGYVSSCRQRTDAPNEPSVMPIQEIDWVSGTRGWGEWGQTSDGFFGVAVDSEVLMVWTWTGDTLSRGEDVILPSGLRTTVLSHGEYLVCRSPGPDIKGPWPLVHASLATHEIIQEWPPPKYYRYSLTGISHNSQYLAVLLEAETNMVRRVGLLDLASGEFHLVGEYEGWMYGYASRITCSNDGKYIAIAGWDNGLKLYDVDAKTQIWFQKPDDVVNFGEAEFSPDGKTIYTANTGGESVYAYDTLTGEIKHQWYATATGQAERRTGRRISCFAVSPDGNWLAAGTGPKGDVFLFDVNNPGSPPTLFPHGLHTTLIVNFSPDSKHLASVAGGKIKIWKVSE